MSEETLLQKALAVKHQGLASKSDSQEERIELAIAWCEGTVTATQAMTALNIPKRRPASLYNFLAMRLREAAKMGILVRKGKGTLAVSAMSDKEFGNEKGDR